MPTGVYKRKPRTPEHCANLSKAKLGVLHTSPAQIAADEAQRGVPRPHTSPAQIAADKLNGERRSGVPNPHITLAQIVGDEAQRGGNDIVEHHVSYDMKRPEALIVKVTRKFHSSIHHPKGCQFGTYGYSLID